ncbi:YdeI/OmpD-associated family protein [Spirosoma rigui]|uniref:YdeI/OmpD-associated family protein n=1 Tax=Spirosoma rigui TaxID=564064 RepID=UPI0009AF59C9|nr:YdeI/OmpD-associated family protein [Spirosoma rigui]
MNATNPVVDFYFNKAEKWQNELALLRTLVLDCGLAEELKWGVPCYTYQHGNVLLIHTFKEYCAILFIKGALLQDTDRMLVQQTENVQAGRQIRFTSAEQLLDRKSTVKAYIFEAIEVEKAGLKVELKKAIDFPIPEELQRRLDEDPALKTAFGALTPGRQRAYILYINKPKQAATRTSRVEKCVPQILIGKGLTD